MAFDFICPFCHSRTKVEDRYAGQSGPCAECGKRITLPSPASLGRRLDQLRSIDGEYFSLEPKLGKVDLAPSIGKYRISMHIVRIGIAAAMMSFVFGVVGWLIVPSAQRASEERRKLASVSNIQQIAKAMNAYRRDYGSYPTPTATNLDGLQLYSWRVLLLPYLGYKDLHSRFQLDQPWDSPSNILLASEMPTLFVVAGNAMASSLYESNYSLVVGPGTLFATATSKSVEDILDDPGQTILVVESKEGGICWMEPGNLDNLKGVRIGSRAAIDMGGNFSNFVLIATVDGNSLMLNAQTAVSTIQALLSPDGDEVVSIETVDASPPLP